MDPTDAGRGALGYIEDHLLSARGVPEDDENEVEQHIEDLTSNISDIVRNK